MGRIRTVKPEYFLDEDMAELSMAHRLLFIGLWTQADREGRLEDKPKRIKATLFPWDDIDVNSMLSDLELAGVLFRYEAGDKKYIEIKSFAKHQRPHPKEMKSEIPAATIVDREMSREKVRLSREKVVPCREKVECVPRSVPRGREGKEVLDNGKEVLEIGKESPNQNQVSLSEKANAVFEYWKEKLKHPKAVFDSNRRTKVEARLNEKRTVEEIKQAINGCSQSPWHQGENPDGVKYDDLELICRSAANLEKFIAMATSPPKPKQLGLQRGRVDPTATNWDEVEGGIREGLG